jgi:hypothetical protein
VFITSRPVLGDEKLIVSQYQPLIKEVSPGHKILLDDGNLELEVVKQSRDLLEARVVRGGVLKNNKGMNLPDTKLLDMRLEPRLAETLAEFQPDVVGVTCLTTEVYNAQDLLKEVRATDPEAFTVVGGLHASLVPADFQQAYVDAIVIGEGELTFAHLLEVLDRNLPDRPGEELAGVPIHLVSVGPERTQTVVLHERRLGTGRAG